MRAPLPANETERLETLWRYHILDSEPEPGYDDLTFLATYLCQAPVSLVTFIAEDRQWFKARRGTDLREVPRDLAFCGYTILRPAEVLVVPDLRHDARFADHPLVVGPPHMRFYAGAALVSPDGYPVGSLCVFDTRPRRLRLSQREALQALARQAVAQLERRLLAEMRGLNRALEAANRQLEMLATTDGLTGLKNHRAFQEAMRREFAQSRRSGDPVSLVLLDIDHFKEYNDAFGHPAGDDVLRLLAHVLNRVVRAGDVAARYGGEEFAVILPDTDVPRAVALAERLRRTVEEAPWPLRPVTASFGVAAATPTTPDHERLILEADDALYRAKARGRNRVYPSLEK